jgi:hypothetical protein
VNYKIERNRKWWRKQNGGKIQNGRISRWRHLEDGRKTENGDKMKWLKNHKCGEKKWSKIKKAGGQKLEKPERLSKYGENQDDSKLKMARK